MPEPLCIDTNVFLACLSADEATPKSDALLEQIIDGKFVVWAPALINFELGAVLNRKAKDRLISDEAVDESLNLFFQLPILLVWNKDLLAQTHQVQKKGKLSWYDASYLALAQLKQIPLITNDQELIKKGRKIHPAIYSTDNWVY